MQIHSSVSNIYGGLLSPKYCSKCFGMCIILFILYNAISYPITSIEKQWNWGTEMLRNFTRFFTRLNSWLAKSLDFESPQQNNFRIPSQLLSFHLLTLLGQLIDSTWSCLFQSNPFFECLKLHLKNYLNQVVQINRFSGNQIACMLIVNSTASTTLYLPRFYIK